MINKGFVINRRTFATTHAFKIEMAKSPKRRAQLRRRLDRAVRNEMLASGKYKLDEDKRLTSVTQDKTE